MNFFQHQHHAKQRSSYYIVLLLLAIVLMVVIINALFVLILWFEHGTQVPVAKLLGNPDIQQWLIWLSMAALLFIMLGSLYGYFKNRNGGDSLATLLDAKHIDIDSRDPKLRQFIHVVQEMSIASGVSVPTLYLLSDEPSINAFVAGLTPMRASMFVTQGTLEHLDRAELQAVVGHEFSHILNGDMRINLRLMALVAGILSLTTLGRVLMPSPYKRSRNRRSSSSNDVRLIILGIALIIVGYIGVLFARLIKAAVSRQRELLADAASVQFTRDPLSLAMALTKIKRQSERFMLHPHAEDVSHFCITANVSSWFSTHPSLEKRIETLDPQHQAHGLLLKKSRERVAAKPKQQSAISPLDSLSTTAIPVVIAMTECMGQPSENDRFFAKKLLESIPALLQSTMQSPAGMQQVVLAILWLENNGSDRLKGLLLHLKYKLEPIERLAKQINVLGKSTYLSLVELGLNTLAKINEPIKFIAHLKCFCKSDQYFSLLEFALLQVIQSHLLDSAEKKIRYQTLSQVQSAFCTVAAAMIKTTASAQQNTLYQTIIAKAKLTKASDFATLNTDFDQLEKAIKQLQYLAPKGQQQLIDLLAQITLYDGKVTAEEAVLLRALCAALECPLSPNFYQQ